MAANHKNNNPPRGQELLGLLIIALSILVLLGIVSRFVYPTDYPNHSHTSPFVRNWLGLAGAWISYYLNDYTIGHSCIVFPLILFLLGWTIFLQREFKFFFRFSLYFLALGIFLSTSLALPGVISAESSEKIYFIHGHFGRFIAEQLNHYLGAVGSIIVLLTFLVIFLISATSWSMRESILGLKEGAGSFFTHLIKRKKRMGFDRQNEMEDKRPIHIQPTIKEKVTARQPISIPVEKNPVQEKAEPADKSVHREDSYRFPPIDMLVSSLSEGKQYDREALEKKAYFLEEKLREFDVQGEVVGIQPGPVITRFEVKPAPGVKVSRFVGCQDDLALVMQAQRVRVVAPIPGKAAVGIEIPNEEPALVSLRSILESRAFQESPSKLTLALGQTIEGKPYVTDLAQMPHLLVAGATGSGKSVCLNTIITSMLYRAKPSEVKLVLIDPKKLELTLYRKLHHHHLTTREDLNENVITTLNNAISILRSLEVEMERRYRILARVGVRNIEDYNRAVDKGKIAVGEEGQIPKKLPYVVIVVDELADLMVTGAREVEEPIARLAQMSRAVGLHLILATQRPSVDVITGVIKANFPSRIAFQVTAKTDSRTILDRNGAEKLLGRGDMLFLHPREPEPLRIHGAFISAEEVQRIVHFISQQPKEEAWRLPAGAPKHVTDKDGVAGERDELFREAAKLVIRHQQGSASLLQRRLRIGYARAGRLIDELEDVGILGPFDGSKAREVLVDERFLDHLDDLESQDRYKNGEA
ncbi:DNA translocase FtsK [bacterium]|nr:DNA translocase FtsK [bacterium]RQV99143.1 MAG: DNA translocase FtsK [bacterium]